MRILPLLTALAILPATLPAQGRPNTREGFWIGFGFGPGSAGTDCNSCTTDRISGFTGYLRMGGTISPKLLLGGETNGWVHSEGNVDESMSYASFIAMWYPSAMVQVGLGVTRH